MSLTRVALVAALLAAMSGVASSQSLSRQLAQTGWEALRNGNADRAASAFGEALTLSPSDPVLLLGAGAAAHALGREQEACRFLQKSLTIEPRLMAASLLLGEIAYRLGDLDVAIKTYEAALKHAPYDVHIAGKLEAWRNEATVHQRFEERRDDRFRVMFEGQREEKLASRATAVLNTAFGRIAKVFGEYPSGPITVILYTEQQFRDITRITQVPDWSDGVFDEGRIRLPVRGASENLPRFDRVLTHELTHAVVHSLAPRGVPTWLHEGLAMYFEPDDAAAAERRLRTAHVYVRLSRLEGSFSDLNGAQALLAYNESLYATNALLERIGTGIGLLLQDLGSGQTFGEAVQRFGFTYEGFQRDLERRIGARPAPDPDGR